jgi:hypothetical protein
MARVAPAPARVAVPEMVVTTPEVGSMRNTVSPVAAEVTLPRSTLWVI